MLQPADPNERFRERRRRSARRKRLRRFSLVAVLVLAAASVGMAARATVGGEAGSAASDAEDAAPARPAAQERPRPGPLEPREAPFEVRGVHVTMALASIPGKLNEYLRLRGLNTLQLDVKDENGEVGFVPSSVPLAKEIGAAKRYYKPRVVAQQARAKGIFLIGRIVCFEDPILAVARPELAVHRRDGSVWKNHAGLGWTNPYDERVWDYLVDLGEAAARVGFDEIQFDYVRFPSDGDVENMVFPVETDTPPGWVIPQFVQYASKRLKKLGVRVSVDVFGLAATRDLGIGQRPARIARYVDAVYPMVYPSHYRPGEYKLDDPNSAPRRTVAASLQHFERELQDLEVDLIPWLQDFSYGRTYTLADVQAQIDAAAAADTRGFLLWNAAGVYSDGALTYEPGG
jgi:hypothetical protein